MTNERSRLLWLDMEMTGLDVENCVPVQIALVVTDSELDEIDAVEYTIWQPEHRLSEMSPFVRNMHTTNGLVEQIRASELDLHECAGKVLQFVARHFRPNEAVLCGNSIHQDRKFIARYFPTIDGYLHYRMIDVSTIKELVKRWYGQRRTFQKAEADHTALADVRASIAELRHYRQNTFVGA